MLEEQLHNLLAFFNSNPMAAAVVCVVLACLVYFKPKSMMKLGAFCLFFAIAFYLITLLTGTVTSGSKQKDSMIYKSKDILDK